MLLLFHCQCSGDADSCTFKRPTLYVKRGFVLRMSLAANQGPRGEVVSLDVFALATSDVLSR